MPLQISYQNSYLTPPGGALVATPGTGAWTILVWVKPPPIFNTHTRTIWYLNNGHCLRMTPGQQLQYVYGGGSDNISALSPDVWVCTAVTKNATTAARYYLNGVYQSQRTSGLSSDNTAASTIGAWNGSQDWLYANASGLKVWDAVLTDAEIAQESAVRRPIRTADLRAWYPFIDRDNSSLTQDYSGNGRHLTITGTGVFNSKANREPPIGYGAPVLAVGGVYGPPPSIVFATPARRVRTAQPVTIEGGQSLSQPLIELALMADASGRYTHVIDRARIRAVSGSFGFQRLGSYMTDNASVNLELRNDDGAYTQGGGLWVGQWGQVRLAGSGEVLFTGRITEMTPGYGVNQPYVRVTLDTLRNSLNIPARSVLLKDTHVGAAAEALLADVRLTPPMGELIWDYGAWDDDVWWPGKGRALRLYGDVWTGLAAAGGYGRPDGELDVLGALGDLMTAEDGRAVWGRDNALELYSRQWLDNAREGAAAYTLTDDEIVDLPLSIGDQYVNEVAVQWTPTYWQAGATVFRYAPDTPASVKPGEFRDFSVRFRVEGDNRVIAVETPVVSVTSSGGSVSWAWTDGVSATGGNLRVSNAGPDATGISAVVVTGAALIASTVVEERRRMAFEQTLYGVRAKTVRATLIDRSTEAVARADREFVTGNERASYAGRLALRPRTRAEAVRWLTLPFASGVEVNSARASHHARYLAIGVDWRIGEGGVPVDVTLALEPVVTGGFLRWDGTDSRGAWDSGRWAF